MSDDISFTNKNSVSGDVSHDDVPENWQEVADSAIMNLAELLGQIVAREENDREGDS